MVILCTYVYIYYVYMMRGNNILYINKLNMWPVISVDVSSILHSQQHRCVGIVASHSVTCWMLHFNIFNITTWCHLRCNLPLATGSICGFHLVKELILVNFHTPPSVRTKSKKSPADPGARILAWYIRPSSSEKSKQLRVFNCDSMASTVIAPCVVRLGGALHFPIFCSPGRSIFWTVNIHPISTGSKWSASQEQRRNSSLKHILVSSKCKVRDWCTYMYKKTHCCTTYRVYTMFLQ